METVELHPAFMWDCESCGAENFVRTLAHNPEPVSVDDPDVTVTVEYFSSPAIVKCGSCNTSFRATGEAYDFDD